MLPITEPWCVFVCASVSEIGLIVFWFYECICFASRLMSCSDCSAWCCVIEYRDVLFCFALLCFVKCCCALCFKGALLFVFWVCACLRLAQRGKLLAPGRKLLAQGRRLQAQGHRLTVKSVSSRVHAAGDGCWPQPENYWLKVQRLLLARKCKLLLHNRKFWNFRRWQMCRN